MDDRKPGAAMKKRNREDDDDDEGGDPPGTNEGDSEEPMSRSERKRHREKKRRSDVNKGFDNLMNLLLEIDPEVRADAEDRARKGHCKRTLGAHEDNLFSRVDLIATAVQVLKRIHTENEANKKLIQDLVGQRGGAPAVAAASAGVASMLGSPAGADGIRGLHHQNPVGLDHPRMGPDLQLSRFMQQHSDPRAAMFMDRNSLVQEVLHGHQSFPMFGRSQAGGVFPGFQTLPHGNLLAAQQRELFGLGATGAGGLSGGMGGAAARAAFLGQYGGGGSDLPRNVLLDGILQNTSAPMRGLAPQAAAGALHHMRENNFPQVVNIGQAERKEVDDDSDE